MHFSFYTVDPDYCSFIRLSDPLVPHNMGHKAKRPFLGIVLTINDFSYYAPLTSPKPKHIKMKDQIDFIKINDGHWGAINLNNMIPVPLCCLNKVQIRINKTDSPEVQAYNNLLTNQLSWCNSHRGLIYDQAKLLYALITHHNADPKLRSRCCDFTLDEQNCLSFSRPQS